MTKYLNKTGLVILWNKIKELLNLKVNKEDIKPILIEGISFYELIKYSEDSENYNGTEITSELIDTIYNKAKQASDENRPLVMTYGPISDNYEDPIYFEIHKIIIDTDDTKEASLSAIINNFVYNVYIDDVNHTINVKKLNNTSVNLDHIKETLNNLETNKVDKIEGKQLTTEDFTTMLKEKLESLENYNDEELDSKIEALKSRLDTLVGSGNVTEVIDTFQEIETFLQGITNTETLTGLLQDLKSDIVALCNNTYLPLSGGIINSNETKAFSIKRNSNAGAYTFYENNSGLLGSIGITGSQSTTPYTLLYNDKDGNDYKIFHEGNDGSGSGLDADKLDGTELKFIPKYIYIEDLPNKDLNKANGVDAQSFFSFGTTNKGDNSDQKNVPTNYGMYFSFAYSNINQAVQFYVDAPSDNTLGYIYIRTRGAGYSNDTYNSWEKLAYLKDIPKEWYGTQAQYDALTTKDANTTYYITE